MSRRVREKSRERGRRRKIALITGTVGFALMLLAVQVLAMSGVVATVAGWMLLAWGIGAALWTIQELWATRAR